MANFAPNRPAGSKTSLERQTSNNDQMQRLKDALAAQPAPTPAPVAREAPKNDIPAEEVTPRDANGNILGSEYERVALPSNFIFYDWNELSVRRFEPMDQAKLARAVRYKNMSLVLDVMSSTCNRDVREMAVGDFYALCIWHRLNSYMNVSAKVTWLSRYGNQLDVTVKRTVAKTTPLAYTREQYLEYVAKGFAVPTARDLETTSGNKIDEDVMYLFEHAQYVDTSSPEMKERIARLQKAGDRIASITARVEKLNEMTKGTQFSLWDEIDEFAEKFSNFGVQEIATIKDDKFDPERAIEFLLQTESPEDFEEANRIQALLDQNAAAREKGEPEVAIEPVAQEVPLAFSLWNMFCYV